MEITQEGFEIELQKLAEKNWKVKKLLSDHGGYNNLPQNIKTMIDKLLGITRTEVLNTDH